MSYNEKNPIKAKILLAEFEAHARKNRITAWLREEEGQDTSDEDNATANDKGSTSNNMKTRSDTIKEENVSLDTTEAIRQIVAVTQVSIEQEARREKRERADIKEKKEAAKDTLLSLMKNSVSVDIFNELMIRNLQEDLTAQSFYKLF